LQQALVNLEQAQSNLTQAQIRSPISGTVLAINPTVGQQVTPGEIVATLADPSQLQLTVDVAEVDIPRLHVGQQAQIAIDAFAGQTFRGEVSQIAPVSDSTTGVINYPVTIRLTGDNLAAVRPGMTAVATISGTNPAATDEWFVPTNSIQRQGGAPSVTAMRNGAALSIPITPTNQVQGDWTLVNAAGLQSGDQVVGSVTTKITSNPFQFGGGGGPGGGRQGRPAP
ncbi:MAG TPA: efflux RND transporter periplasmic adaptor subunit, partial [Caldilineaceae bacterium]|nr:efflux RND transporter periplasmic adaptor subunit [Caldilineaceae bacterium]